MRKLLPVLLVLAACASRPAFRKGENGYTESDTPIPEILLVRMAFPANTPEEYRAVFLARAAGEECAARNFPYFEFGATKTGAKVFCSAKNTMPHLGASFAMIAQASSPAELRVEDTQMGKHSPFRPWDVVRKIDGRAVNDVGELKEAVFLAARKGAKEVSVLVERSEIPLAFTCALSEDGVGVGTPDTLVDLRSKAP